jgi:hypothetical protein
MKTNFGRVGVISLHWLARVLVVAVFLLWGAFFVEHTQEWFIAPFPQLPPLKVCVGQGLHLLMLIGLLTSLRWPRLGIVWVVVTAFAFFVDKTGSRFPVFFGLTILPVLLLGLCAWLDRKRNRGTGVEPATAA